MKVAVITDTHFGVRNDSQIFIDHFVKFYDEVFFPHLEKEGLKTLIHAGDTFDRRKHINFNVLDQFRKCFFDRLADLGVEMHCVIGNHDTYYKNTNDLNSPDQLLNEYSNIKIYKDPTEISIDGRKIALLPWVNAENSRACSEFIESTDSEILIGHLELDGFESIRGIIHEGGIRPSDLQKFTKVLSGHFHCKQSKKNVCYLGSPYQMVFSDAGEERGFWDLDTKDLSMNFHKNPDEMFYSLSYDDEIKDYSGFIGKKHLMFKDKYVKLYVVNKTDSNMLDSVTKTIQDSGVYSLSVMEVPDDKYDEDMIEDMSRSTIDIIMEEIDKDDAIENKGTIKTLMKELYMESLTS